MNWKTAYLETRVLSAGPVELISILYEYAILRVQDAREALREGNIVARAQSIAKVISIIGELDSALDHKAGGEIAVNLRRLYRYMTKRLAAANQQKSDDVLAEVEGLLKTLGEAWCAISESSISEGTQTSDEGAWALAKSSEASDYSSHAWTV